MIMMNKIFFKISALFAAIIIIYVLFITFIISPKITNYLLEIEKRQAKTQLNRISTILEERENYIKSFQYIRLSESRAEIKRTAKIAYNIMSKMHKLYKEGKVSKEEALSTAYNLILKIEYGHEDDYLYVLDRKGTLIFHPDKRFHKKNIYYQADANGRLFVPDIVKNSVENKFTYTRYSWTKLNSDFISEKIVYSIYFEPFDLIVNAGVYVENLKQEIEAEKIKVLTQLTPLIKTIDKEHMGYVYAINKDAKVVLHPVENLVNIDISQIQKVDSNITMMESLLKAYEKDQLWEYKWNKAGDENNFTYEKISWVSFNDFFEWYIVSSIYKENLENKAKEINSMIMNVSLIILAFLTFIAIIFIRKLLLPITTISKNADLVKAGNFDIRNNVNSNDELGSLAEHFDSMMDYIEENTKTLEKKVEERTKELADKLYFDELTGLKNRNSLVLDIEKDDFLALSIIDIDRFDEINELYGFEIGNELLIEVCLRLEEFCIKNDIEIYKLHADRFALLDSNMASFMHYDRTLEKLQQLFIKEFYLKSLKIEINIYVTIGTAISQGDLLKTASIALKKAKKSGLRYIVYNEEINTKKNIEATMFWRDKIQYAIDRDKIVPFFQPILNREQKVIKYETLMRIEDEENGKINYLSPYTFFDVALKTKQYYKLSRIIFKKAIQSLEKTDKVISINLAFIDIVNREFNDFLKHEISQLNQRDKNHLVFEILESDHISDYQVLENFIDNYRKEGIKFAIDDFGTGFSNFEHILRIKPDYLKIDGSLVKNIDKDKDSYEMVKSIAQFSKSLNIKVIAEFVHSKEVFDILQDLEVDEFQGYYLGEPSPLIQ